MSGKGISIYIDGKLIISIGDPRALDLLAKGEIGIDWQVVSDNVLKYQGHDGDFSLDA